MSAATNKKEAIPELMEYKMQLQETAQHSYFVSVDPGVTKEQVLNNNFWRHVALRLTPYTLINVTTDDGAYYLELLVISCGRNWAVVKELRYTDLQSSADVAVLEAHEDELEAKFQGPINKWCVINKSTGEVLKKGMQTKDEAFLFVKEHAKAVSR